MSRVFYHRTTADAAERILAEGFRDSEGRYGTSHTLRGVWLADRPLGPEPEVPGDSVIRVELDDAIVQAREFTEIVKGEGRKDYREWVVPASLLKRCKDVRLLSPHEIEAGS